MPDTLAEEWAKSLLEVTHGLRYAGGIYIGRRFKIDTEHLDKFFEPYTKMTAKAAAKKAER